MSNLKKFKVSDWSDNFSVVLEVDLVKLTAELADEINSFWSGADDRLAAEGGDVVKAVIRLYGANMIGLLATDGGSSFSEGFGTAARIWTELMQKEEGWPGADGTPTGAVGIRLVRADVVIAGFDELELTEVAS